jgi:Domain of unknown function (DUF4041)/T5orf172 domain
LWISDEPQKDVPMATLPASEFGYSPLDQPDGADLMLLDTGALKAKVTELEFELRMLRSAAEGLIDLDDERVLQEVGIYRYHHPLENAVAFKDRLEVIQVQIKEVLKSGEAILASDMFTYNNSLAKGRKMVSDFGKLMLRAYNAEADNCVRSLRAGNVETAKKRLNGSVDAIAKLGSMMDMRVSAGFHELRIEEIELTGDWLIKVQEERENAREERERLREERRVQLELTAERERLDKERNHYAHALAALEANGDLEGAANLASKLAELEIAIEANDYRIANIRAGYVYVISNVGAFGPGLIKIGLTRRLEPTDRIRELGDASVPFLYDTHALFFSDDAVTLEKELHKAFAHRRVNWVNERREFFFATPLEVRNVLVEKVGSLLEFTEEPNALEYFQSKGNWAPSVSAHSLV